ncbi:MAG: FHA domain-containing protein [Woeseiaceae bacterium]|nr:FHA domain-containing protein [Woeseiaceae bacterium]
MPEITTWFPERAFGKQSETRTVVPLQTQQSAVSYLLSIVKDTYGVRALIGPESSGKTTVIDRFRSLLRRDIAVAMTDGAGQTSEQLLTNILKQFGYQAELESADDLLKMVNVFAVQQTRVVQPPVIIVENLERMRPAALRTLCLLAGITFQGQYALRIVVTGTIDSRKLLDLSSMKALADRIESIYELEPLTPHESMLYLHGRLEACDVNQPDSILPIDVCDRMHELSGGNPGQLCRIARGTLQQAVSFPATLVDIEKSHTVAQKKRSKPKLIVSQNGDVVAEYELSDKKITIGRSSLADIQIQDERVSKFHALLLLYSDALVIADLNSANGTSVNSRLVKSTLLRSDDILAISSFRLKVVNAPEGAEDHIGVDQGDTSRMKTLDDMRQSKSDATLYVVRDTTLDKSS